MHKFLCHKLHFCSFNMLCVSNANPCLLVQALVGDLSHFFGYCCSDMYAYIPEDDSDDENIASRIRPEAPSPAK